MAITPGGRVGDAAPFSTSTTDNWVARAGGLPTYIREVAHALVRSGHSESDAIATAVATMKRWAAGLGNVRPQVQAAAAKALAEWEAKRGAAHVNLATPVAPAAVHGQLTGHYPMPLLTWIKQARWQRAQVPLKRIDMAHRPGKPHDPAKVAGIREAIRAGKPMKPVVLVDKGDRYAIADGYHRTRAFAQEGHKTVNAVVATGLGDGPWDRQMHVAKLNLAGGVARYLIDLSVIGHQWKHGWIPLTPAALAIKLHRAHGSARGKSPTEVHKALRSNPHYRAGMKETFTSAHPNGERLWHAEHHDYRAEQALRAGNREEALRQAGMGAGHRLRYDPALEPPREKRTAMDVARQRRFERTVKLQDYQAAREADVRAQEERTKGYKGDIAHEKASGVKQPITFKDYLRGGKEPAPAEVTPKAQPRAHPAPPGRTRRARWATATT